MSKQAERFFSTSLRLAFAVVGNSPLSSSSLKRNRQYSENILRVSLILISGFIEDTAVFFDQ